MKTVAGIDATNESPIVMERWKGIEIDRPRKKRRRRRKRDRMITGKEKYSKDELKHNEKDDKRTAKR